LRKKEKMREFSLGLKAPIQGIYLNSETIDLLSIIQCKSVEELKKFVASCEQLGLSEQDETDWNASNLEALKRRFVKQYQNTLVSMEQGMQDKKSTVQATLVHCGIATDEMEAYITTFLEEGYIGVQQKLQAEHPEQFVQLAQRAHRFIARERDQMKQVTYEELLAINEQLPNHNTILLGGGRYYDVVPKLYPAYDFYQIKRGLDFCYHNGMQARYHTLLDKQTMEEHLIGKSKEEILAELSEYVSQSMDFISQYNQEHKIGGKGLISSVDLWNEIVSFDPPYQNQWQALHGISIEELLGVFSIAQEKKPEGVTYVYNEPFLENPERRQVVLEQLKQIHALAPRLIDTIGTQMHITMQQEAEAVRQCFYDLKGLQELGIGTQITEFDMCLPESHLFDEQGQISQKYTPEFIYQYKEQKMQEIAQAIRETGIELEGVTYWSVSDTLDHNGERTNENRHQNNVPRAVVQTRYAGLYSDFARKKTVSTQKLGKETLAELKDTALLDEIQQEQARQERELEPTKENE